MPNVVDSDKINELGGVVEVCTALLALAAGDLESGKPALAEARLHAIYRLLDDE